ncbi:hypothetical protein NKI04_25160 [Mesorhizobium sp. M0814]|uniref:hypothetical protein n=1 Tax=Mesorhizobium sp. M0814 TaxID=2957004 RepID=UPI003335EF12
MVELNHCAIELERWRKRGPHAADANPLGYAYAQAVFNQANFKESFGTTPHVNIKRLGLKLAQQSMMAADDR